MAQVQNPSLSLLFILSPLNLLVFLSTSLVLFISYLILYYRFLHPLRHFPGPFLASITRLWIAYHNLLGDECAVFSALHHKHGPVIRITPTMLLISDATQLPEVYSRQANKSNHYITGSFGKTESLFNMQEHKQHARFRKIAAGPYGLGNVRKMEVLIDDVIGHWIERLETKFAKDGEKFDFAPWAVYMAYDIISSVGFGAPFGFVASGTDVAGLIRGFHDGLPAFGLMARLWPLTHWIKSTWLGEKYLVAKPTDNSGIGTLMRYRDGLIAQRQQDIAAGKPVRMDFLQTFLEARTERDEPLPMDYIKAEILLVMLAGADTTGTAFQSILAYMLADPISYEKLMTELEHVTRAGKLSDIPTYDEVQEHCPFYMACVKESMRLCPPAPTIFPRIVGPDGLALPGGRVLPPGTEVTCNPWLVQRDTALYGPDASEFRPERWMQSEQQTKLFNRYSAVFGYGPRVCLGRDIAMMELCKAPLQFFRVFRAKVVEGREGKFVVKGGIGFWRDMWITIEKREGL